MKKTLFFLLFISLFIPTVLHSQECRLRLASTNPYIAGSDYVLSACSTATDEVGDRENYANTDAMVDGEIDCILYEADCTGTLEYAFLKHVGTDTDNCKVGACNSDGDAPDNGDDGCVWSTGDAVNTDGWVQLSGKLGKAVVQGTNYFVCAAGGSGGCSVYYKSSSGSKTLYYEGDFTYASLPSDLTSPSPPWAVAGSGNDRNMSVYIRIE